MSARQPEAGGFAGRSKVRDSAADCRVLFLCTGNSARSILAEALLNSLGAGWRAYSAGSHPKGRVHPLAIETLERHGIAVTGLASKGWETFSGPSAPALDVVITVCDQAAGEVCPIWPGAPVTAHWGLPDPAAAPDGEPARGAFEDTYQALVQRMRRLRELPALPSTAAGRAAWQQALRSIAEGG